MYVFISLVDPGLDLDLLHFWIDHYSAADLDRYMIFLHRKPGKNDFALRETIIALKKAHWEFNVVEGSFGNGVLQKNAVNEFRESLSPGDIIVAADSDEFHSRTDYRSIMSDHELMVGRFEDRWDTTLHHAIPGIPLEIQYPLRGDMYEAIRDFCDGDDDRWASPVNTTKVLSFVNEARVNSQGFHDNLLLAAHTRSAGHRVLHYSWRKGVVRRMVDKTYHRPWYIKGMLMMLNVGPEDPELKAYEDWAQERQKARGWEPCRALTA